MKSYGAMEWSREKFRLNLPIVEEIGEHLDETLAGDCYIVSEEIRVLSNVHCGVP